MSELELHKMIAKAAEVGNQLYPDAPISPEQMRRALYDLSCLVTFILQHMPTEA